jgi:hypothetical protein
MHSHISLHRGTIKVCSNSFVFKNEIEKEGLPRDTSPALGAGGPDFKSERPDQNISRHFIRLSEHRSTSTAPVENKQTGVQDSHVVQPKKVTPLGNFEHEPGRRRASAKNAGKTRGLEAKKTVVGGKFRGLGPSKTQACRTIAS